MGKKAAVQQQSGLYTRGDYELLLQERRRLNDLIHTLDKAEACGIDCVMYRQMRDEIDKQLEAIQTHFMSPPPV